MNYDHQKIINEYAKIISAHLINDDNRRSYYDFCNANNLNPNDLHTNANTKDPHCYAIAMCICFHLDQMEFLKKLAVKEYCGHSGAEIKSQSVCWDLQTK